MSASSGAHGQDHSDRVFLYAAQVLPADELREAETQIAACAECRQEREALRPIIDAFAWWPADLLRPSAELWERLAQRIGGEAAGVAMLPAPAPSPEPGWADVAPGISCKLLSTDTQTNHVNMLVRLAPGAAYPPHRHAGIEELYLLDGELIVDDKTLHPGDYLRSNVGTVDRLVWSGTGCTCVLMTSSRDVIL
jgi:quercetin dioxygenase-like cupin family protein